MSDAKYLSTTIQTVLSQLGTRAGKDKWSPNYFRVLRVLDDCLMFDSHPFNGEPEIIEVPMMVSIYDGLLDSLPKVMEEPVFGTLEEVYLMDEEGSEACISEIVSNYSDRRLWKVGIIDPEGHVLGSQDLTEPGQPYEGKAWVRKYRLQSQAYPLDESLDEYFRSIEEGGGAGESSVLEESVKFYRQNIKGTVRGLLKEYDSIFGSGYSLIKPEGILTNGASGTGAIAQVKAGKLEYKERDRLVKETFKVLTEGWNIEFREERGIVDIANAVLTHKGNTQLYFPNKMLEFAMGCRVTETAEMSEYPPSNFASSWEKYKSEELEPRLESLFSRVVELIIQNFNLKETFYEDSAQQLVDDTLLRIKNALSTCILITKMEDAGGVYFILKIRVLDPTGHIRGGVNYATEAMRRAQSGFAGENANSVPPKNQGIFSEFTHEADRKVLNAEPLFAYKALQQLQAQGLKPSMETLILGIDDEDKVVTAGPGKGNIDLTKNLTHGVSAGSRSGKGVMTQNIAAGGIMSWVPLFYLDDKPDISSVILELGPEAFVVNGPTLIQGDGSDHFNKFRDRESWIRWGERVPDYVMELFPGRNYNAVGSIIYARALMLVMGIIAARVKHLDYEQLGGDKGIMVVVDELTNANSNFATTINNLRRTHLANMQYQSALEDYKERYAKWEETGKGAEPRLSSSVQVNDPSDYWFTAFYDSLKSSINSVHMLGNAGLKNKESKITNIFVLAQTLFNPIENVEEIDDLFVRRNSSQTGAGSSTRNNNLLPSLVFIGGIDGFIGYTEGKNVLARERKDSPSFTKLDSVARNFAYVNNLSRSVRQGLEDGRGGYENQARYFKPFLIFGDGKQEEYFVDNMFSFVEKSGISKDLIISRNEDPKRPGRIHPGVGFKEYLMMAGNTEDQIAANLAQSGKIAQHVVNRMGYPGTWHEFVHDLRTEWIFSVDDVVESLSGHPLKGRVSKHIREFVEVYPDLLPEKAAILSGEVVPAMSGDRTLQAEDAGNGSGVGSGSWAEDGAGEGEVKENSFSYDFEHEYGFSNGEYVPPAETDPEVVKGAANRGDVQPFEFKGAPERYNGTPHSYFELITAVTDAISQRVNPNTIERIFVIDGVLVINSRPITLNPPQEFLSAIPPHLRQDFSTGRIAAHFNWFSLPDLPRLSYLRVDSPAFMSNVVSRALGIRMSRGPKAFFEVLSHLNTLQMSGSVFRRSDFFDQDGRSVAESGMGSGEAARRGRDSFFFQRYESWDIDSRFEALTWKGARKSAHLFMSTVRNPEMGLLAKAGLMAVGASGAAVTGAATGLSKVGRGLMGGLRQLGKAFREA